MQGLYKIYRLRTLIFSTLRPDPADDEPAIFSHFSQKTDFDNLHEMSRPIFWKKSIFTRKQVLTFHANCLRRMDQKAYFLEEKKKGKYFKMASANFLSSMQSVNILKLDLYTLRGLRGFDRLSVNIVYPPL